MYFLLICIDFNLNFQVVIKSSSFGDETIICGTWKSRMGDPRFSFGMDLPFKSESMFIYQLFTIKWPHSYHIPICPILTKTTRFSKNFCKFWHNLWKKTPSFMYQILHFSWKFYWAMGKKATYLKYLYNIRPLQGESVNDILWFNLVYFHTPVLKSVF